MSSWVFGWWATKMATSETEHKFILDIPLYHHTSSLTKSLTAVWIFELSTFGLVSKYLPIDEAYLHKRRRECQKYKARCQSVSHQNPIYTLCYWLQVNLACPILAAVTPDDQTSVTVAMLRENRDLSSSWYVRVFVFQPSLLLNITIQTGKRKQLAESVDYLQD